MELVHCRRLLPRSFMACHLQRHVRRILHRRNLASRVARISSQAVKGVWPLHSTPAPARPSWECSSLRIYLDVWGRCWQGCRCYHRSSRKLWTTILPTELDATGRKGFVAYDAVCCCILCYAVSFLDALEAKWAYWQSIDSPCTTTDISSFASSLAPLLELSSSAGKVSLLGKWQILNLWLRTSLFWQKTRNENGKEEATVCCGWNFLQCFSMFKRRV